MEQILIAIEFYANVRYHVFLIEQSVQVFSETMSMLKVYLG